MGVVIGVNVADSAFVWDETFVNNSSSNRFVVFCIFCEYSFVWFLVDSIERFKWSFGVVWYSSAECFCLGMAVWAEVSEIFEAVVCVVSVYVVNVERERQV